MWYCVVYRFTIKLADYVSFFQTFSDDHATKRVKYIRLYYLKIDLKRYHVFFVLVYLSKCNLPRNDSLS